MLFLARSLSSFPNRCLLLPHPLPPSPDPPPTTPSTLPCLVFSILRTQLDRVDTFLPIYTIGQAHIYLPPGIHNTCFHIPSSRFFSTESSRVFRTRDSFIFLLLLLLLPPFQPIPSTFFFFLYRVLRFFAITRSASITLLPTILSAPIAGYRCVHFHFRPGRFIKSIARAVFHCYGHV